VHVNADLKLR